MEATLNQTQAGLIEKLKDAGFQHVQPSILKGVGFAGLQLSDPLDLRNKALVEFDDDDACYGAKLVLTVNDKRGGTKAELMDKYRPAMELIARMNRES